MNATLLSSKSRSYRWTRNLVALCLPVAAAAVTAGCPLLTQQAAEPECACDAAITKLALNEPVAGETGLYALVVNYGGHELCEGGQLCVDDSLPAGLSCDPADPAYTNPSALNPDWTCSCTGGSVVHCCLSAELPSSPSGLPIIYVPVLVAPDAPDSIRNCASIAQGTKGSFEDNTPANNTSCVETGVAKPKRLDLAIEKSHDVPLAYGGNGVFHLAVSNQGNVDAAGFTVTDVLPPGFEFVGTDSPGWSCTAVSPLPGSNQGQTVTCVHSGTLSPATATMLDLHVTLGDAKSFTGKSAENCATVSAKADVNPKNDTDCDPYCIDYVTGLKSGQADDFDVGDGAESPSPSPDLLAWINTNYPIPGVRDYDEGAIDHVFGHTFTDLAPPSGYAICGAQVTLRVRCIGGNDTVNLHFTDADGFDPTQAWSYSLNTAPLDVPCDGTTAAVVTLDLSNLPPADGAASSLLPGLNAHGFLDVIVQDDTAVDFVSLDMAYCCQ